MTSDESNRLFKVSAVAGGEPFEEDGLRQRTDFQSQAPRAGADFKEMAIRRVTEAGAAVERIDFEIDDIPVDAQVRGKNGRSFLVMARGTRAANRRRTRISRVPPRPVGVARN